jgi:membrane-bound lytic murein transglycosylase B
LDKLGHNACLSSLPAYSSPLIAPFGEGTANFEVMSEWNRSVVYRKTLVLFAEQLAGP